MSTYKFPIEIDFETGGKSAIERLIQAYGFTTRQALADHLNISKSTLANRYLRDTFPSDWIIRCTLETGASLTWLTTGKGPIFEDARNNVTTVPCQRVFEGLLHDASYLILDNTLLNGNYSQPLALIEDGRIFLAESKFDEITDGKWLVKIEGKMSIKDLTRIPVGMVKVVGQNTNFNCLLTDITPIAKCKNIFTDIV